jgi:hypothetical protein
MFNQEDFNHLEKMNNSMADGMTDGSEAHMMLEKIIDHLSETDFLSDEDRMKLMMNCINLCYDKTESQDVLNEEKVIAVVLGLCFNYTNVVSNLVTDGFQVDEYYSFLKKEILPVMKEESTSLPYWDINE